MKTESENLFEDFCEENAIGYEKIAEGNCRSPDYLLSINGLKIVTEVKQFNSNKDNQANYEEFKKKGFVVWSSKPGIRVYKKITGASKQISNSAKGRYSGLLVLYNTVPLQNPLDSYEIKVAAYGLDTIVISKPGSLDEKPYERARKSGPNKKFTENHNTSISAIGVLTKESKKLNLCIYHNYHAAIPIPDNMFEKFGCQQYKISNNGQYDFSEWVCLKDSK